MSNVGFKFGRFPDHCLCSQRYDNAMGDGNPSDSVKQDVLVQ